MFKKGEIVIYPQCGTSKIIKIYTEEINGSPSKYYELIFEDNITVGLPIKKAESLGLRYPLSKRRLRIELKKLKLKFRPNKEASKNTVVYMNEKFASGLVQDAVELIKLLRWIEEGKKAQSKNLSLNERVIMERAVGYVRSEIIVVLGEGALKHYNI